MVHVSPPAAKRIKIEDLKRDTYLVLWIPFSTLCVAIIAFSIARLLIKYFTKDEGVHLERWTRLRNWLALLTSGGQFYEVHTQQSIQQATSNGGVQSEQSIPNEATTIINMETPPSTLSETASNKIEIKKDCLMANRRIPATVKGAWYNLYLLFLPLQLAIISIIIVHNIYHLEYDTLTCASIKEIADRCNESIYYDCKYGGKSQNICLIFETCNQSQSHDLTSCTVYYYNPSLSDAIQTILNGLLLHFVLAKGIIHFMIGARYLVYKLYKIYSDRFKSIDRVAQGISAVLLLILCITLAIVYKMFNGGNEDSSLTFNMIYIAGFATLISIILFMLGSFQCDLYERLTRCSFNVSDDHIYLSRTANTLSSYEELS